MKKKALSKTPVNKYFLSAILLLLATPIAALACLWDYDTLRMERNRFPTALELITGKFLRHSKEFYEWRILDRLKKIDKEPNRLDYYDDLAVAFSKTGQHTLAIEWILKKEKIKPGLYETYSNLGTFHILAGNLELGLPWIDKALSINPNAHFGRERYQKWLVEYALSRKKDGVIPLPLQWNANNEVRPSNFKEFVQRQLGKKELSLEETQTAIKGILGMMRFANHDNPLLLETLGDLLFDTYREGRQDAKRLAAFAYLKASLGIPDPATKKAFLQLADNALKLQTSGPGDHSQIPLASLEKEFQLLQADADAWYAQLREKEITWIQEGKDADAEFDQLYNVEPSVQTPEPKRQHGIIQRINLPAIVLLLVFGGIVLLIFCTRKVQG